MVHNSFVEIKRGRACGSVRVPTSKSIAHRALICAALVAHGQSTVSGVPYNDDIDATLAALRALGLELSVETDPDDAAARRVTVVGCGGRWTAEPGAVLPCHESGSTLRFMLPLCLLSGEPRALSGSERLLQRPLDDDRALFRGRTWEQSDRMLRIGPGAVVKGQRFCLEGKSSSQFVTGLLHILPLLEGDSTIALSVPPESRSYIDMTLAVMARFGVRAVWTSETELSVTGGQSYHPTSITVDGDASGAAFFEALRALGHEVRVTNSGASDVVQGDSVCPRLLSDVLDEKVNVSVVSLADCPDLGPVLFAAAAVAAQKGKQVLFTHTARLRLKESDRVAAMVRELSKLGACLVTSEDVASEKAAQASELLSRAGQDAASCGGFAAVLPTGKALHAPDEVLDGHNDHRVVMALSVLCAHVGDGRIGDACAVRKSFPTFFDALRSLGVTVTGDM